MTLSEEWTEWHLTPRGWEIGSERKDFGGSKRRDPPEDRVLTCKYEEVMPAAVKMYKSVAELWRSDDDKLVQKLLKKYGKCLERLYEPE